MFGYILRRVLQMIPVLIGVTVLLFVLRTPGLAGGDPVRMIAGERGVSEQVRQQIEERHGLDQPLYRQYVRYVGDLARGDLGESYQRRRPVADILAERFPATVRLALAALAIEVVLGVVAGIVAALKRDSFLDVLATLSTALLVSIPVFWLGMLLQVSFGIRLPEWTGGALALPTSQISSAAFPQWAHLMLPAVTLASVSTAYVVRIMRTQMAEVLGREFILAARAKGVGERGVVMRHAARNAVIPVLTFVGLDLGAMMGGAILTETVFSWPGIGREIFLAVGRRDWPVVTGGTILIVAVVMVVNLAVDILYAVLDPRIRYGGAAE